MEKIYRGLYADLFYADWFYAIIPTTLYHLLCLHLITFFLLFLLLSCKNLGVKEGEGIYLKGVH